MSDEMTSAATDDDEEQIMSPQNYLDLALQAADDQNMPTSELLGIFYYYTHGVAATYRDGVMNTEVSAPVDNLSAPAER